MSVLCLTQIYLQQPILYKFFYWSYEILDFKFTSSHAKSAQQSGNGLDWTGLVLPNSCRSKAKKLEIVKMMPVCITIVCFVVCR